MKKRFIIKATGNGKEYYITTRNMQDLHFTPDIEDANKYHKPENVMDAINAIDKNPDPIYENYYYQVIEVYTKLSV